MQGMNMSFLNMKCSGDETNGYGVFECGTEVSNRVM